MSERSDFEWQSCNEHVTGNDTSTVGQFPESCYECYRVRRREEGCE